ncbi:MAG TPA: FAD-dependent oxidoreductase [Longimicrobiales bacterium]|nr:FAD-dependent oxidoreductase [Longimicrobiales bacterium]
MGADGIDLDGLPDLLDGVPADSLETDEPLVGRVGDEAVLLVRTGSGVRAVQATCPHYGAPLADGCVHRDRIHCPWHHASFELGGGALRRPPALDPLNTWAVEEEDGVVRVTDEDPLPSRTIVPPRRLGAIVVVGAGAAGTAAVLTLRREGHEGPLLLVDPDPDAPYDRPNLSKDYLAGTAPEEWLPLRPEGTWEELDVERVVDDVVRIDHEGRALELGEGRRVEFEGLILATGAEPRTLPVPGADADHVFTLRSLADCRAIRDAAEGAGRAVIVGAGFLGLEAAASLRNLDVAVDVVAPEEVPLERVFGPDVGNGLRKLHEEHGVTFHLERSVEEIDEDAVVLDDGSRVPADLVLVAIGVKPRSGLAAKAGIEVDDGVVVDELLATALDDVYAAGDIARFPHPGTGRPIRIEHWAVAEAQGRAAALNLLGHGRPFRDIPFFWTAHYGVSVRYSGFPDPWDRAESDGSFEAGSLGARLLEGDEEVAAAFVGRDREALRWEIEKAETLG